MNKLYWLKLVTWLWPANQNASNLHWRILCKIGSSLKEFSSKNLSKDRWLIGKQFFGALKSK